MASIQHPAQQSRLLNLPAELRLKIYEYVFEGHIISIRERNGRFGKPSPPSLLPTCKQIYTEAVDIFYACATFSFNYYEVTRTALSLLPSSRRKMVQGLQLDETPWCSCLSHCPATAEAGCRIHGYALACTKQDLREMGEDSLAEKVMVKCLHCYKEA